MQAIQEKQRTILELGQKIVEQGQDIHELKCMTLEQAQAILEFQRVNKELRQQVEEQQLTINELIERAFRHRSERYVADPNQLKLDFGNTPEAADAAAGLAEAVEEAEILVAAYKRRKRVSRKPQNEQLQSMANGS
jgi:hypothetical protein